MGRGIKVGDGQLEEPGQTQDWLEFLQWAGMRGLLTCYADCPWDVTATMNHEFMIWLIFPPPQQRVSCGGGRKVHVRGKSFKQGLLLLLPAESTNWFLQANWLISFISKLCSSQGSGLPLRLFPNSHQLQASFSGFGGPKTINSSVIHLHPFMFVRISLTQFCSLRVNPDSKQFIPPSHQ